jgi:hypothetical protein
VVRGLGCYFHLGSSVAARRVDAVRSFRPTEGAYLTFLPSTVVPLAFVIKGDVMVENPRVLLQFLILRLCKCLHLPWMTLGTGFKNPARRNAWGD